MNFSCADPLVLRAIKGNQDFVSAENRIGKKSRHHKFKTGDRAILVGLESFPEYNGEDVVITNVREDGDHGRAYYIQGRINEVVNWVYEYRLQRVEP